MRVHIDFAEPQKGNAFLVIVDAFSKYVDAAFLHPASGSNLVDYLRVVFRHFGPPETVVSDNGGQFTSAEFAPLCQDHAVVHLRTSPYAPQGNGAAEKMVSTLKNSLEEATQAALDEAVAAYNGTPCAALGGKTPAEVFFRRALRSNFSVFRTRGSGLSEVSQAVKSDFDRHHGVKTPPPLILPGRGGGGGLRKTKKSSSTIFVASWEGNGPRRGRRRLSRRSAPESDLEKNLVATRSGRNGKPLDPALSSSRTGQYLGPALLSTN